MSFFTYVFGKGYTGGPDFSVLESFRFDLEGIDLSLIVPKRKIALARSERNVNLPFRSPGWFDNHCKQQANHFYASVFVDLWPYNGPFWRTSDDRLFGILGMEIEIKRVLPDRVLDVNDLNTLAEAIRWDYEWYFEVAEQGKYGQGSNREARAEIEARYAGPHWQNETGRQQREAALSKLRELPTKFETRRYDDQAWLYYALERESNTSAHYYCQPLDDQYYLYVRFGYRIDLSDYFHLWQADAEAAEQRIMETVTLTFPNRLQAPDDNKAIQANSSP